MQQCTPPMTEAVEKLLLCFGRSGTGFGGGTRIGLAGGAGLWIAWLSASATAGGMAPTARIVTLVACMPACNFLFDMNMNLFCTCQAKRVQKYRTPT